MKRFVGVFLLVMSVVSMSFAVEAASEQGDTNLKVEAAKIDGDNDSIQNMAAKDAQEYKDTENSERNHIIAPASSIVNGSNTSENANMESEYSIEDIDADDIADYNLGYTKTDGITQQKAEDMGFSSKLDTNDDEADMITDVTLVKGMNEKMFNKLEPCLELKTYGNGTWKTYCQPIKQPKQCPDESWQRLASLAVIYC